MSSTNWTLNACFLLARNLGSNDTKNTHLPSHVIKDHSGLSVHGNHLVDTTMFFFTVKVCQMPVPGM